MFASIRPEQHVLFFGTMCIHERTHVYVERQLRHKTECLCKCKWLYTDICMHTCWYRFGCRTCTRMWKLYMEIPIRTCQVSARASSVPLPALWTFQWHQLSELFPEGPVYGISRGHQLLNERGKRWSLLMSPRKCYLVSRVAAWSLIFFLGGPASI